ncbi:MAG: hypothetical protein ACREBW_09145 [Candidatus Micrarchaeaceae archaeon]
MTISILISDNGHDIENEDNVFVPLYMMKMHDIDVGVRLRGKLPRRTAASGILAHPSILQTDSS